MSAKSLRFVLIANWIFACFFSFTLVTHWDELSPLPVESAVTVTQWDRSKPANELHAQIEQFMMDRAITAGRVSNNFDGNGRTLYVAGSDPIVQEWLHDGYRDFTRSVTTHVRPFADLGAQEPVGSYVVFGDYAKAVELGEFFSTQGMRVNERADRWSLALIDRAVQDQQSSVLKMMVLVSVAVAAAGVLLGARAYGVKRLQGFGYGGLLLSDLRRATTYWLAAGALVLEVAAGFLAIYNGLASFGIYLLTTFVISCVLAIVAIGTHALALALLMQLRVLAAVKGELPARTASAAAYLLQAVTVVATVVLAERAIETGLDLKRRADVSAAYTQLGSTSRIGVGNVKSAAGFTEASSVVGAWLRAEEQANHLVLAGREIVQDAGALRGRDLMYVNENFLHAQPIRLADGTRVTTDGPALLIPADLWDHRDEMVRLLPSNLTTVDFKRAETAVGQEVFTYTSEIDGPVAPSQVDKDHSFAKDPIVVFLPSRSGLITVDNLVAFATQGRVLFPNPQTVADAVAADPELRRFVVSATPAAAEAAEERTDALRDFRLALFGVGAGVLVLFVSGIGAVLIHTRRNAQLIFARHVSGWRFITTHRMLLAFEAVVLAVLVGWLPYQAARVNSRLAEYTSRGSSPPFDPVTLGFPEWGAIGVLAVLTVGGVVAALIRAHRRVVRAGASEA
ncbi:hypothetical protein [Kibdelosporangium aridum]|uniref:hypothetical protein n=1 Tax=Kibdelosporangium aridum TaxID=2030 RepID=UPI0035F08388